MFSQSFAKFLSSRTFQTISNGGIDNPKDSLSHRYFPSTTAPSSRSISLPGNQSMLPKSEPRVFTTSPDKQSFLENDCGALNLSKT